jgi:pSer/pThr/pTyr-binding forkhead associated (FHA) protein
MKSLFERLRQISDMLAERGADPSFDSSEEKAFEVILEGQSEEAKQVLEQRKLMITKFPFLIGRESLNPDSDVFYNNDLAIHEQKPYVISRNHLAITNERGRIWVIDRGSAFGTVVNGREIGGLSGITRAHLDQEVNQVIIGHATSKYIFLVRVLPA